MKRALITGITGQDGSYLAELLLGKGYEVHGLIRRASTFNTARIDHLYQDPHEADQRLFLHYGDLCDGARLVTLMHEIDPDEVYNLAAQSHVRVSFDEPEHTGDTTGIGLHPAARGGARRRRQVPVLPGVVVGDVRRDAAAAEREHALPPAFAVRRGQGLRLLDRPQLPRGLRTVRGQRHPVQPRVAPTWRDLRDAQDHPGSRPDQGRARGARSTSATSTPFATGATPRSTSRACGGCCRSTSPKTSCWRRAATSPSATSWSTAFEHAGLDWEKHVRFDERYLRPSEVDALIGDASKAEAKLGWKAQVDTEQLARIMVDADIEALKHEGRQWIDQPDLPDWPRISTT